jgi:hypothetical protein
MGPAFYIMAILGCGEADTQCQPVATVPARYESAAACNAATEDAIAEHGGDALYPVVVAQCRKAGEPAAQQIWADEVNLPEADAPGRRSNERVILAQRRTDRG